MKLRYQINLKQSLKASGCFLFFIMAILISTAPVMAKGFHLGIISAVKDQVEELKKKIDEQKAADSQTTLTTTTKILTTETIQQLTKQEGMTLFFTKQATEIGDLQTGDIIISKKDDGFLRKVTSVTSSASEYIVVTSTATLEQAFSSADVTLSKELTQTDINTQKAPLLKKGITVRPATAANEFAITLDDVVLYDFDGSAATTNDRITTNGSLTFKITIDFKLEIDALSGVKFIRFVPRVEETGQLEIKSEVDIATEHEEEIGRFYFAPILVGPVVFIPEVPILVGVDVQAGVVLSSSISHVATFTSGLEFDGGTWTPVRSYTGTFGYDPPTLSAEGEIKCYIGPQAILKIYGVIGPYLNINGYLKMVAEATPNVAWKLYGGLEAYGGVDMTIFSLYRVNYTAAILDYSSEIASGEIQVITNHAPVIATLIADPAALILNQNTTVTCTASDADSDTLTYAWSAASGTLTGSGAQVTWTAPAVAGSYTVSCLVSDGNNGVDSKSVSVTVTGSWEKEIVDSTGDIGAYPSLAFDSSNKPHISYWDYSNSDLRYVKGTGVGWSLTTVDSTGEVGEYTSLRLDSSGNPHIAYRDYTNSSLKYAKWNGSTWDKSTVLSSGEPGMYNSLALDVSNNPQIATRGYTDNDLISVGWNGWAWIWYAVDSTGRVGEYNSIQVDTSNNAHIAYLDADNGTLKYAKGSGTSWTIETIAGTGTVAGYIALALDSSNNPHIVFSGGSSGYLKYATKSGSTWSVSTIDAVNASGFPSIVVDNSKNPHVSYHDWTNKDLKYARWTGSAWVIMTIDSSGNQGPESSIALDTSGNPHIAYYDGTNGDLKYASWLP